MSEIVHLPGFVANAFLIVDESAITFVDPGAPCLVRKAEQILRDRYDRPLTDITTLVPTHWHIDHVGGVKYARKRLPKAKLLAPRRIEGHLTRGEPIVFPPLKDFRGLLANRPYMGFMHPEHFTDLLEMDMIGLPYQRGRRYMRQVDRFLDDGDTLPDHADWRVIETPGHSPDSLSFWHAESGTLISGDNILGGDNGAFVNLFYWDRKSLAESVSRVRSLPVTHLCPGHGRLIDGDGILDSMYPGI
ncbi:MBL fold metallo-hydrolase [bacterium]|nr:MBL fold metallo-hydrolase [bacterium]